MSSYLQPREMVRLLRKLKKAKEIRDISTFVLREEVWKMFHTLTSYVSWFVHGPDIDKIIDEFVTAELLAALMRLVELRSESANDQSSSAANLEEIDIEDNQLNFSGIYRYFSEAVLSATACSESVCSYFASRKAIDFLIRDLKTATFTKYKTKSPSKSQTAAVINIQMGIILNIYKDEELQAELRRDPSKLNEYLEVLKMYCSKRSAPHFSSFASLPAPQVISSSVSILSYSPLVM